MTDYSGNNFTRKFNLRVPIVQGPMGGVAGPELVAAVANAVGLGILPIWHQPAQMAARAIAETQALTDSAFGVNLRADLVQIEHIRTALDAGVSIIHLFWGDPSDSMGQIDAAGARMIATIGDAEAAKVALDAGASALIAQGVTLPDLQRRYTPGMRLPVGSVRVSVARDRYEPANREVMIRPGNNAIVFNLQRIRQ